MRVCDKCSKKSLIQKSGAHQYGGGWAMRATKKRFEKRVNLHSSKVTYKGVHKTMRLCTKCLRIVKADMKKMDDKQSLRSSHAAGLKKTEVKFKKKPESVSVIATA